MIKSYALLLKRERIFHKTNYIKLDDGCTEKLKVLLEDSFSNNDFEILGW